MSQLTSLHLSGVAVDFARCTSLRHLCLIDDRSCRGITHLSALETLVISPHNLLAHLTLVAWKRLTVFSGLHYDIKNLKLVQAALPSLRYCGIPSEMAMSDILALRDTGLSLFDCESSRGQPEAISALIWPLRQPWRYKDDDDETSLFLPSEK